LIVLHVSGCVLVPFVQAFKETGLTEGDRMELLPPQLKKFSDARVFGNKSLAMALVASESQPEISKQLQDKPEQERIVKSQVDEIEWSEDARKARVVMKVESFTMSQLIVKTKREEQRWEFSPGSGWLMTQRAVLSEG
jgi:ribosome-binding factor A